MQLCLKTDQLEDDMVTQPFKKETTFIQILLFVFFGVLPLIFLFSSLRGNALVIDHDLSIETGNLLFFIGVLLVCLFVFLLFKTNVFGMNNDSIHNTNKRGVSCEGTLKETLK